MPPTPPRRGNDGQLLCSVAKCGEPAVWQREQPCESCDAKVHTGAASAAEKHRAAAEARMAEVVDRVRERGPLGPTEQDRADYLLAMREAATQATAAQVARRDAVALAEPHTHPVFACAKHEGSV